MEDSDIRIRDLRGYTLIGFQRAASPKLYDDLQAALSLMKFSPNYISDPVNETEILALVSAGAGLVSVPQVLTTDRWVRFRQTPTKSKAEAWCSKQPRLCL